MEGEHRGARKLKDVVAGSKVAAAEQRRRAQHGAAATARKGNVVQRARATAAARGAGNAVMTSTREGAAIAKEVERSMQKGTALVQAAIEHLQTAEGLWDRWVQESDTSIDGYPSKVQVMTFMCKMSRTRQL